ncbi:MAG: hypothetical protein JNG44_07130 [Porphyromonas sp.]|uniref:hypothetical protein n=1 Tax=Porphyromonas sp. TaxID=1924944 RepID=UPI001A4A78EA|nr:hypothetical protein [Porphyromonas sp.]MBL6453440.1 hypothetical protein [Porphyromonas sp.]
MKLQFLRYETKWAHGETKFFSRGACGCLYGERAKHWHKRQPPRLSGRREPWGL